MPLPEGVEPVPMARIAVVARTDVSREALLAVASLGAVELELAEGDSGEAAEALRRLHAAGVHEDSPRLPRSVIRAEDLEARRRADLLAGEIEMARRRQAAVPHGDFTIAAGWCPRERLPELQAALASVAAAVVELKPRPFQEPPTLLRAPVASESFRPLVETYGTVHYADIDPTLFTAFSFVLMFGMMFADAGDGLLLALAGVLVRLVPHPRLQPLRRYWLLGVAAGLTSAAFGAAYGEAFGPTGIIPALWLRPLQDPLRLLVAGVLVGSLLLAISYLIGTVNRWREGGFRSALYSASGLAGLLVFLAVAVMAAGVYAVVRPLVVGGAVGAAAGLALMFVGLLAEAGRGPAAVLQATVELFNSVIRLGANSISFARLAAFGMVHAAIGELVWNATSSLWHSAWPVAIAVFAVGSAVAFLLELLVAGIQALRLEYYELFSRIYQGEGRPFAPWKLPVTEEVA